MYHLRIALPLLAFLLSVPSTSEAVPQDDSTPLRVMSFNIRFGTAPDGENHWDQRQELVARTIRAFRPDLVGTQETLSFQARYLQEQLPEFLYVGRSRDAEGDGGEQCGILFRAKRFDKLAEGHFWLSETPDRPGSKSWDSSLPRIATWVKLWDRKTEQAFFFINTHFDHRGETARQESAKRIRQFIDSLDPNVEVVLTGDFNAAESSKAYQLLFAAEPERRVLIDTWRALTPSAETDEGTFNGFQGTTDSARIDWIAVTSGLSVQQAGIDRTQFTGRFPSDHFPVTAVLSTSMPSK